MVSAPPRTVPWKLRLRWLWDRPVAFLLGTFLVAVPPVLMPLHYWMTTWIRSQAPGEAEAWPFGIPLLGFYLICMIGDVAVGLLFLSYAIAGMRKKVKLYTNGLLTTGKIIAIAGARWLNFLPAFQQRFRVTYRFQDDEGKDRLGSSSSTNLAFLNAAKQGDPVSVLFLKSRPDTNCLAEEDDLFALPERA